MVRTPEVRERERERWKGRQKREKEKVREMLSLSSLITGFLSFGTPLEPVVHPTTQASSFIL
jgi:hypothetical protein